MILFFEQPAKGTHGEILFSVARRIEVSEQLAVGIGLVAKGDGIHVLFSRHFPDREGIGQVVRLERDVADQGDRIPIECRYRGLTLYALTKGSAFCTEFIDVPKMSLFQNIPSVFYIKLFDLRSRPRGPSQELQAGLDARVIIKASDIDDLPQLLPPMMLHQLVQHHFQGDTVKWIFMLLVAHIH